MAVKGLERKEIFKYLRPDQVHVLSKDAELVEHKAGEVIYHRGAKANYFYIVLEGLVTLRLPGKEGMSILIDQLAEGSMFGSCVSFAIDAYVLTAQCAVDTELLRIRASVLKELLDEELQMGYAIQSQISKIYFQRYIETMKKLQAIVMNVPLEKESS